MSSIFVSVIVPLYNEEKYIDSFLLSLMNQTYPQDNMEWILVDGESKDFTKDKIQKFMNNHDCPIILLDNKDRIAPCALNMAIQKSRGKYIIRMDAHSEFYPDYIEKCVYYLENTDASNVGGIAETTSTTFKGKAISHMLSTKFGVGGSDFRIGEADKYVDTVPFGAFRREVFDEIGLFNTKLIRSEDNDMNSRIRQSGRKIWLSSDIRFKYFCRDTVSGILKMGLQNGNALFFTLKENPSAMSVRHFIPFLFVLSLIACPILIIIFPFFKLLILLELGLYFLLDLYFSFNSKCKLYGFITVWLYPLFHVFYGLGSFLSLIGLCVY